MIQIKKIDNRLIIENYNTNCNLNYLDVADNLEVKGVFIRIDNNMNIPVLIYKQNKYLVKDEHIKELENQNRVVFKKL